MQFSTTPTLEGQPITEYCSVVYRLVILGASISWNFFAADLGYRREVRSTRTKSCVRRARCF